MEFSPSAPAVLLSPHLDDAVLSAWSVLNRPEPLVVVNVFAGVPQAGFVTLFDRATGAEESADAVRHRLAEDREALRLAKREPICLDFLDGQYRGEAPDREAIAAEISSSAPTASALFMPAGLGGHEDHVAVRDLGFEMADRSLPLLLYADLPYAIEYGWPDWVSGTERNAHLDPYAIWEHYLENVPGGGRSLEPEAVRLSDRESDEKLAAMRTYRTQFPLLNAGAINRLANPAIRRYEVLWTVSAP